MEYQDCSDVQLSALVRQGQGDAFAELSARYLGLIRAKAQRFEGAQALFGGLEGGQLPAYGAVVLSTL